MSEKNNLVLSIFPGIDLLGRAFEEEGYCVVRGPDLLWGGDIRTFHPPAGVFEGVIGGPPCQLFSVLSNANPNVGIHGNLIPEFERVISEVKPGWFMMENVKAAPVPSVPGYLVKDAALNNRWFGAEQNRMRRFSFGSPDGSGWVHYIEIALFEHPNYETAVLAGHDDYISRRGWNAPARSLERYCEFQGLPRDFLSDSPFTVRGQKAIIGNGVPMPMGRAIAKAVRKATRELE